MVQYGIESSHSFSPELVDYCLSCICTMINDHDNLYASLNQHNVLKALVHLNLISRVDCFILWHRSIHFDEYMKKDIVRVTVLGWTELLWSKSTSVIEWILLSNIHSLIKISAWHLKLLNHRFWRTERLTDTNYITKIIILCQQGSSKQICMTLQYVTVSNYAQLTIIMHYHLK